MLNQNISVCFSADTENSTLTAKLSGEIDHHNAFHIREKIDMEICAKKPHLFILDLKNISFMDSSGLGLILGRMNRAKELEAEFILTDPSPHVEKVLSLAGMERMVKIERSE